MSDRVLRERPGTITATSVAPGSGPAAMQNRYELVLYGEHTLTSDTVCTKCGASDWNDDLDRGCYIRHEYAFSHQAALISARQIVLDRRDRKGALPGDWERALFDVGDLHRWGGVVPLPDGSLIALTRTEVPA